MKVEKSWLISDRLTQPCTRAMWDPGCFSPMVEELCVPRTIHGRGLFNSKAE